MESFLKPRKFGSALKRKAMGERGYREDFWEDRYWGSSFHYWEVLGGRYLGPHSGCPLVGRGTWESGTWLFLSWGGHGGGCWESGWRVGCGGLSGCIFEGKEATGTCQFGLVGRGGPPPESCGYRRGELVLSQQTLDPLSPLPQARQLSLFFLYSGGK